jgi:hypothetical protein
LQPVASVPWLFLFYLFGRPWEFSGWGGGCLTPVHYLLYGER